MHLASGTAGSESHVSLHFLAGLSIRPAVFYMMAKLGTPATAYDFQPRHLLQKWSSCLQLRVLLFKLDGNRESTLSLMEVALDFSAGGTWPLVSALSSPQPPHRLPALPAAFSALPAAPAATPGLSGSCAWRPTVSALGPWPLLVAVVSAAGLWTPQG